MGYRMPNVSNTLDYHQSPTEGNDQKECRETPKLRAEKQGRKHLHPSQIKITTPINPFQFPIQTIVCFEQSIARPSFLNSEKIRKLQIVLADRIAEVAHRNVPAFRDAIECIFDQLIECNFFGVTRWDHPHFEKCIAQGFSNPIAHLGFGLLRSVFKQVCQLFTFCTAESHIH